jgi:hypothetical protein
MSTHASQQMLQQNSEQSFNNTRFKALNMRLKNRGQQRRSGVQESNMQMMSQVY